jgi:acylphosphatase
MTTIEKPMQKCHSIVVTGKVQDIGFRSVVEHIGRSFGIHGLVFNGKDGSVKILCCGEDSVIDNFTQAIKVRGEESGAKIKGIKGILLPFNIDLPEEFSKVSSDDEIDLGRKLDKGNEFLKTLPDIKDMLGSFIGEQREHNAHLEAMVIGINEHNTRLETMMNEQNARLDAHNTRLEAILEKLVDKS